jgi:SAM-dependent methyltransferase
MKIEATEEAFFERMYRANSDPWNFATSAYEQGRYQTVIDALNSRRYERAFEPGCSVGELTARLAEICDEVEAMDISRTAVKQAQARCRNLANVRIACGALPDVPVHGDFDLMVLSEIGYYFEADALNRMVDELLKRLRCSGTLLATHWLGISSDHVLSGDRVHEILRSVDGIALEHSERHAGFRLDRWVRT